eukprot:TRINITY_DN938_c0_g4_i4.p1 TRINITY_DN938_c0_g4~~TRINITY_DN938_c0_g4_i4.p1  ORF type:complete len:387 (-),score=27.64 TRINITY_DN938_c0_g4_i4:1406-2566(-)
MSSETLRFRGVLVGHSDWVTAIATPVETSSNIVLSASRDKTIMVWEISSTETYADSEQQTEPIVGSAKRSLRGHNHYVQDVVLSLDGQYCLSGSWDGTLRLWDLNTGQTTRRFSGHTKDVLSVAFSVDNRQIVSGSRDKSIKLWNTLGECKYTWDAKDNGHTDWVSCVRFSPVTQHPVIVSGGWDKQIKVWNLGKVALEHNLVGHTGYINAVTVSPDGSLCASGGKDGTAMLWDLSEGKRLYMLEAGDIIHALCFSPMRYWLVAATQRCIKVWDLESKSVVEDLKPDFPDVRGKKGKAQEPYCVSLAWSADGSTLYAGFTNGKIYSYVVTMAQNGMRGFADATGLLAVVHEPGSRPRNSTCTWQDGTRCCRRERTLVIAVVGTVVR